MATTASAIIDTVRTTVNHSALSDTQVLVHINNTQRVAQRRYPLTWFTEAITATFPTSTAAIYVRSFSALVSDVKAPLALYAIVSGEHTLVPYNDNFFSLIDSYAGATAAQTPDYWTHYSDNIYLFPTLSTALSMELYYNQLAADLTVTAANTFVTNAPEVLEWGAVAEYYDSIGEAARGALYHQKADGALKLLLDQHRSVQEHARPPITITPGTVVATARRKPRGWTWS